MFWNVFIVTFLYICSTGEKFQLITVIDWYLRTALERTNGRRTYWEQDFLGTPTTLHYAYRPKAQIYYINAIKYVLMQFPL